MNLVFRLLWVILRALRWKPGGFPPFGEARLAFRILPTDLDFNLHVNNARYLSLMDLGRVDLLNRLGLLRFAFRGRWLPVLGAVNIRFQRPLHFLDRVELVSRIVGWDEKWFYLEQRFEREGKPVATAEAAALVRDRNGSIPTARVLSDMRVTLLSPPLPAEFQRLAAGLAAPTAGSAGTE